MTDRHKTTPMSLRLPEALSAWLTNHSDQTSQPVRRIILTAITEYQARQQTPPTG